MVGPYLRLELSDSSCILFSTEELSSKTGLIFNFHGRNLRIPGFYKNKTQHLALFSTKTNQGIGFIFIGPNSLSQVEDLAAVNHVTQAGSKIGS